MYTITVRGLAELQAKLSAAGATAGDIQKIGHRWGQQTRRTLISTPYPPLRPRQKYRRTFQFRRRWAAKGYRDRIVISNAAQSRGRFYAEYVAGQRQARIHRGRWWQAVPIVQKEVPQLLDMMAQEVESKFGG